MMKLKKLRLPWPSMGHKERHARMIYGHHRMVQRLLAHNPEKLPPHIDVKKLEDSYRLLDGYELVLRKKVSGGIPYNH